MMESKRVLSFAAVLLGASFAAQAAQTTYTFASVTGIQYGSIPYTSVTGVLVNDTAVSTVTVPLSPGTMCTNFVVTMLTSPGTYTLTLVLDTSTDPMTGSTSLNLTRCRMDRNP